jgi:preprotein translocase subunit Sss1
MLLAGFGFLVLGVVGYFLVVNLLGQLFGSGRLL